jgi:hypothetical protein
MSADRQVTLLCPFCPSRESRTLDSMAPDRWQALYAWWVDHVRRCAEFERHKTRVAGPARTSLGKETE